MWRRCEKALENLKDIDIGIQLLHTYRWCQSEKFETAGAAPSTPRDLHSSQRQRTGNGRQTVDLVEQTLERARVSAFDGYLFNEILHLPPGRVNRVACLCSPREAPRGPRAGLFNQRDGDIEGKAREGDVRLRGEVLLSLARASRRRVSPDHRERCRARRARR